MFVLLVALVFRVADYFIQPKELKVKRYESGIWEGRK